jgi:N-acetylglucosamine kinase
MGTRRFGGHTARGAQMVAIGIDLGGTKIETQIFDENWDIVEKCRVSTPKTYPDLVRALADQINWARAGVGDIPVGIGAAGLIDQNGCALTANLPATGHPIEADLASLVGGPVSYLNDCRTFTMSEAIFGAGRGYHSVVGLILGTGVGGGIAIEGKLLSDPRSLGGEVGHIAAPANVIFAHNLEILPCGCGRSGCYESYVSGPGLSRICKAITGRDLSPQDIAAAYHSDPGVEKSWMIWCEIVAELLISISFSVDPDAVIIGGGLSKIAGIDQFITQAFIRRSLPGFRIPDIKIAQGGDSSGGRGAAYAAWQQNRGEENGVIAHEPHLKKWGQTVEN